MPQRRGGTARREFNDMLVAFVVTVQITKRALDAIALALSIRTTAGCVSGSRLLDALMIDPPTSRLNYPEVIQEPSCMSNSDPSTAVVLLD